jgi:hypothetical protein
MSAGVSEFGGEAALLAAERLRRPDARREFKQATPTSPLTGGRRAR